jgi:RHS repeat-associated protein
MNRKMVLLVLGASASLYAANCFAAVGRTAGQFQVSPTGSAQYAIPIWAPHGPNGLQPHIALTYNSQSGNGYVGDGWSVSGLSSIQRCSRTIAQDGAPAPITLAISDGYCMDGQRLRLTGGTYGTAGSSYQTEIANFMNVQAFGIAGNGPAYWQTTDKNGWQYTYGGGGTASNAEVLASGSSSALSWQLSEVKDPYGNSMTITYSTTNVTGLVVPNVISWVPASSGSASYNDTMTFNYGTTGSLHGYVGGTPFDNTNLLSSVAIVSQGTALKTYYLTYSNTSTTTSRYLLTELQECAGTGTTNCLAPTNVTWQAGASGVESGIVLSGSVGNPISTAFDFNGDGRNDLVMLASTGAVLVAFGNSSGYGTPTATGLSNTNGLLMGDIDGSGVDSLMVEVSGTWYYYKWNGSAFAGTSTGLAVTPAASVNGPILADVDGDGRPDFVYTGSNGTQHVRLNTSIGGIVSFSSTDIDSGVSFSLSVQGQFGSSRALHFWGDSQADLIGTNKLCTQFKPNSSVCLSWLYSYFAAHFTGSTFTLAPLESGTSQTRVVDVADYNDDGCTDILTAAQLLLSNCNGTASTAVALPPGTSAVGGMDWNGDHRRDVLVAQSSGFIGVVLSTGTGLAGTVINTPYPTASITYAAARNPTGDGQDGLLAWNGTSATYYLHNSPGAPPDLLTSVTDGYGNSASPSYISIAQGNYVQESGAVFPYQNYIGPMQVVSEVVYSDSSQLPGPSSTFNQTLEYYGAVTHRQGRGFQGFQSISTIDSRYGSGLIDYQYFETAFPWSGMQYQHLTNAGSFYPMQALATPNTLIQATLSSTPNEQRYFPYFSNRTVYQKELGGAENGELITTSSTNYTFDAYGNVTTLATTVTDNDPNSPYTGQTWSTTTTNTTDISQNQAADLAASCLSLIDETQITYSSSLSGSSSVTRTKTFAPDTPALCRIKTITTEPTANGGAYKVTEALTFDSFGNVATDTVTGATMPSSPASREKQFNWGATGQFLTTFTDPSGAQSILTYTSNQAVAFGVPDSVKDANNLTISWTYDAFGRKTKETRPDGTSTGWAWSLCASHCGWSNSVYQIAQSAIQADGTTIIRTDTNSYDPIDRITQTAGPTLTGTTTTVQKLYNSLGLVSQQSMPFLTGATAYQQTFAYDLLNRPSSVTRQISSTNSSPQSTTYTYAGRKLITTDPYGHTKTTISDVNGWLRRATDALGYYVTRAYDSAGSLIGITDSAGNPLLNGVTYAYGIKPFRLAATDTDRGAWSYTVDSLGEQIGWTDAKGQLFSMTYDALSRPTSRTEPGLSTAWTWGTSALNHNIGKLASASATNSTGGTYSKSYGFDSAGRPSSQTIAIPVAGSFTFNYGYSSTTGLLASSFFPNAFPSTSRVEVAYSYQNGILSELSDALTPSTIWWQATSSNARGQITQENTGDTSGFPRIASSRTYDAVTGWLSSIQTGVSSGAGLQNEAYLFDEMGNVTQRQNNNLGLTENFYYDNLYRLDHSTLGATTNLQMCYDNVSGGCAPNQPGMGNITSRSDIAGGAGWTYDATHKHRVTQAGSASFTYSYDANGNVSVRNGSTIGWTSYNYPSAVGTSTESATFDYGPDRERWRMVYSGPSGTETTYYATPAFEIVATSAGTDYRHYLYAEGRPVVVISRTTAGAVNVRSLLTNHQGSISQLVTNSSSTPSIYASESFTAYGNRREASTWSGTPTSGELSSMNGVTREGYTFQTVLGSMGLNHMNGRVEDATLGRMISPDPHITDTTNAQNYNRYSYVNNNPMTYTDPTGFDDETPPCDGCGGGGGSGGAGGTPEQSGWSCLGNKCGGGWANTITSTSSSTNPITIQWVAVASGSAAPGAQSPTENAPQSIGGAVADLLGKIWNLPNDALGLVFGGLGYAVGWAAFELGASWQPNAPTIGFANNALQFGNNPLVFAGLGITFGNVESFQGNPTDPTSFSDNAAQVQQHELQHTIQGQVLGPLYLPAYILGGIGSLISGGGNPFDSGNFMEAGPWKNPPQPWP